MNRLELTLNLDTPLLLGGSAKGLDSASKIRGSSVIGLMHHFFRGVAGPIVGSTDHNLIMRLDRAMFGASADDSNSGSPFKFSVHPLCPELTVARDLPRCPKAEGSVRRSNQGFRTGFRADEKQLVRFLTRRWTHKNDQYSKALFATAWLSFALGAIGNRSRRGYGSLTIESFDPSAALPSYPVLSDCADSNELRAKLKSGFDDATEGIRAWITTEIGSEPKGSFSPVKAFFQIPDSGCVYVGKSFADSTSPVSMFLDRAHEALLDSPRVFERLIGSAQRGRLASSVRLRIYKTNDGWVPVVTCSPFWAYPANPEVDSSELKGKIIVDRLLESIEAEPLSPLSKDAT